ncbi:hypothetical protein F7725_025745 [Dissostichus mawsoni]|uniref:Uncharacterized protein n=1 Tax=Dissostichus mawsoni TaxID=36200 RepID=A0A7J5X533_DISMA|nr:hypothetical protein F7725_025745 [Dissostichus mawsoni]
MLLYFLLLCLHFLLLFSTSCCCVSTSCCFVSTSCCFSTCCCVSTSCFAPLPVASFYFLLMRLYFLLLRLHFLSLRLQREAAEFGGDVDIGGDFWKLDLLRRNFDLGSRKLSGVRMAAMSMVPKLPNLIERSDGRKRISRQRLMKGSRSSAYEQQNDRKVTHVGHGVLQADAHLLSEAHRAAEPQVVEGAQDVVEEAGERVKSRRERGGLQGAGLGPLLGGMEPPAPRAWRSGSPPTRRRETSRPPNAGTSEQLAAEICPDPTEGESKSLSSVCRNSDTIFTTQPWKMAASFTWLPGRGSSSEKMARYCVMTSNRCTRHASMVLVMWKYGSSLGTAARMELSQEPRACRNFTRSSASVNTSILRR